MVVPIVQARAAQPEPAQCNQIERNHRWRHRLPGQPARPPVEQGGATTGREVEVLRLATRGLTSAQVADELVISPVTMSMHLRSIFGKIGVNSRTAAKFAMEHGLLHR